MAQQLKGLSGQTKPTTQLDYGATFEELDTGLVWAWDGSTWYLARGIVSKSPLSYRSGVTAADVLPAVGTPTCTKLNGVGSLTTSAQTIYVVAVNPYGRTTATVGNATVTPETTNRGARVAFTAPAGADTNTKYDIYCSPDGANSKWVGRITEAQRAAGCVISAVGTVIAGGTPGAVDVYVDGTGLAVSSGALAQNTAYLIPTVASTPSAPVIDCNGYQYADFDLSFSRNGDAVAMSLVVIPFFYNSRTTTWFAGSPQTITFGGSSGVYNPNKQRLRVEVRDNSGVALVVAAITGTGASLDVDYSLS